MRTQVGIIGAGPAGLFLSHLLSREGIDCVVLEARSREHIEGRVRAGVLEQGTVEVMHALGLDARLRRECMIDNALDIRFRDGLIHLDLPALTGGRHVTIYGQQEVVKDLVAARLADGGPLLFEAEVLGLDGIEGTAPTIRYRHAGAEHTLACDVVAGCDGFHGVCRDAFPPGALTTFDRVFPFGWLGILSESPPIREMTYVNHARGFALCSRRSPRVSRHYVQVAADEDPGQWPDERFWDELRVRLGDGADELTTGRIFQKGVDAGALVRRRADAARAPVSRRRRRPHRAADRRQGAQPRGGRRTGAGAGFERILPHRPHRAARPLFRHVPQAGVEDRALLDLHDQPAAPIREHTPFERQLQQAELAYIAGSPIGGAMIAENYVGLPFEED